MQNVKNSQLFVSKYDEIRQRQIEIEIENEVRSLLIFKVKMAIILPTGQLYAPSAVINDAWY